MSNKWNTADRGIRFREHATRKHGNKADRYYTLRITVHGRRVEEALGWTSEGWTLQKVRTLRHELLEAARTSTGSLTLRDRRKSAREKEIDQKNAELEASVNTIANYFTENYEPWAQATKPKGYAREKSIWRIWLNPNVGNHSIKTFDNQDWDQLVKTINKAKLSQRSREYITGTLRRIFKHAWNRGVIQAAPPTPRVIGCTAPKDNRRLRVLSDSDLQNMLALLKARDIRAWRVTLFAASTGCRAGEAFGLQWAHVDLSGARATFTKTKNGRTRTVPLGGQALSMLQTLTPGKPQDHVFLNQRGKPYSTAPAAFRSVIEQMHLNEGRSSRDRFSFHTLRHMAATRLARKLPLRGLMDVLGWEAATMALRYSHTSDADQQLAAETLDLAFQSVPRKQAPAERKRRRA